MKTFFYRTFARVALIPYLGGTVFHILRLILRSPIEEMPYQVDWVVVVVGGYACAGFIRFSRVVRFHGLWDRMLYGLVILHLGGSVIMHGYSLIMRNHDWATVFSLGYSYFAVFYFVVLGLYCLTLSRRIGKVAECP